MRGSLSGSVDPAALKVQSSSVQVATASASGAWFGGGSSGSRWAQTLATAPLNWSVALEMTAPDLLILPPIAAGWVAGKVRVPAALLATTLAGGAVLPYGDTATVTFDPTRVHVAVYQRFATTFVFEVTKPCPPEPRTRHEGYPLSICSLNWAESS